ncbi:GNAT family N-acetyltransferase [Trinickia fusca]|uniref:GNAT family N-acetyltransferase n=1 Tax=Trinickia fusca TaxID=2419777 RepID=A0A494XSR2_9BURK|nr:GNAT family N-acetyltransferase [Trinickia fusca]RKP52852.1 GNAT family N-acetyltransferase [Trinickia fusca]
MSDVIVQAGDWATLGADAASVRHAVFVREQHVTALLEWDDADLDALHVVAYRQEGAQRRAVASARLLPGGTIGRLAVLTDSRRGGVGSRMLQTLLTYAQQRGERSVRLYARCDVVPFYLRHGFTTVGEIFVEAGIEHIEMRRVLVNTP